ncbi:(2Fe-2S) ferredoxin domain-containing protein [Geomonas sp. RF6]|uniref:(2Fe-2S) ferredoxin domain-containing protein n=1 Tax=Geomonas sp. RF6 TaxID=2897342 RepID=UPI001E4A740D|nr:(2Fe-2S) ferredoxin domain-containing protein [Geomonas sp. RF6]UFS70408.1 (2Fe-2S) ferredoxin domain-containing protein [Geomonas sp. RF6]
MEKIKSLADLTNLRKQLQEKAVQNTNTIVNVSLGTCSIASGGQTALDVMKAAVAKNGLGSVEFTQSGCMCYCFAEPTVEVKIPGKEPVVFGYVDAAKAEAIVEKYIKNGELLEGVIPVNYQRA